jgi:hypothetical protein
VENIVNHFAALPDTFAPESSGTPLALSASLMFQYSAGTRFVADAWQHGGWNEVDALYRNPPQSSQEIIDPSLYFENPSPPLQIEIGGYQKILNGWSKVDTDTFGELLLKIIFQRNSKDPAAAESILPSWRGDRIVILKKGGELSLLWLIAFSDPAAAANFAAGYSSILDQLKDVGAKKHRLEVQDKLVMVVIGPAADRFSELAPSIWNATSVRPQCSLLFPSDKVPVGCPSVAAAMVKSN